MEILFHFYNSNTTIFIICLTAAILFRETVSKFIDNIKSITYKQLQVLLRDEKIPLAIKIEFAKEFLKRHSGFILFNFHHTKPAQNITGDGTVYTVVFEQGDPYASDGIYTCNASGSYLFNWHIPFEGITNQERATIIVETSNEPFRYEYFDIPAKKDSKGDLILSGNVLLKMDVADTAAIKVQIGNLKNPKTVSIASSASAFFTGEYKGKN